MPRHRPGRRRPRTTAASRDSTRFGRTRPGRGVGGDDDEAQLAPVDDHDEREPPAPRAVSLPPQQQPLARLRPGSPEGRTHTCRGRCGGHCSCHRALLIARCSHTRRTRVRLIVGGRTTGRTGCRRAPLPRAARARDCRMTAPHPPTRPPRPRAARPRGRRRLRSRGLHELLRRRPRRSARVGASPAEATSASPCSQLTMGLGCVVFSWRTGCRSPRLVDPGGRPWPARPSLRAGGPAAVGAFLAAGLLLALLALVRPLARLVAAIPTELASAMLAGVLLVLCVAPFLRPRRRPGRHRPRRRGVALALVLVRRWAVPLALVAADVVVLVAGRPATSACTTSPGAHLDHPGARPGALLAITVPLVVVTTTSQNLPGLAVLRSFGYEPTRARRSLRRRRDGGGRALRRPRHQPRGDLRRPGRRPRGRARPPSTLARRCGVRRDLSRCAGALTPFVVAVASASPAGLLESIAGLALLGTLGRLRRGRPRADRAPRGRGPHPRGRRVGGEHRRDRRRLLGPSSPAARCSRSCGCGDGGPRGLSETARPGQRRLPGPGGARGAGGGGYGI